MDIVGEDALAAICATKISHAHRCSRQATVPQAAALSYISLSGGFGTVSLGQIWSASANHYGFAVDPSYCVGVHLAVPLIDPEIQFPIRQVPAM